MCVCEINDDVCVASGCLCCRHLLLTADKHWPAVCVWLWVNFTSGSTKAKLTLCLFLSDFSSPHVVAQWKMSGCVERGKKIRFWEYTRTRGADQCVCFSVSTLKLNEYIIFYAQKVFSNWAFIRVLIWVCFQLFIFLPWLNIIVNVFNQLTVNMVYEKTILKRCNVIVTTVGSNVLYGDL